MENTELQSTFEEKMNFEDLVLRSDPNGILNAETIDRKEEPLEKTSYNTIPIHERKSGILIMDTREIKEESFVQNSNTMSIHGSSKSRMLPTMPTSVETILKAENVTQRHFKQQQKPDTYNLRNNCKTLFDDAPSDKSFFVKIKEIQQPYSEKTLPKKVITWPTISQKGRSGYAPPYNSVTNSVIVGSNPCYFPIATLSIKDLRLRGYSFIRSHASKHGLPNASRKQMKEVIELLKSHYEVVHQVSMLKDDFEYGTLGYGARGGKVTNLKNSSPTMLPQGAMTYNNIKTDFNQMNDNLNEKSIQNALAWYAPEETNWS